MHHSNIATLAAIVHSLKQHYINRGNGIYSHLNFCKAHLALLIQCCNHCIQEQHLCTIVYATDICLHSCVQQLNFYVQFYRQQRVAESLLKTACYPKFMFKSCIMSICTCRHSQTHTCRHKQTMSNAKNDFTKTLTFNVCLRYCIVRRLQELMLQIPKDSTVDCARARLSLQGLPSEHHLYLYGSYLPHHSTGMFRRFMHCFTCNQLRIIDVGYV